MIIFCIWASFILGIYVGYGIKQSCGGRIARSCNSLNLIRRWFKSIPPLRRKNSKKQEKTIWEEIVGW